MRMSKAPQSLNPQPRLAPGPNAPSNPHSLGLQTSPPGHPIFPAARSARLPTRYVPVTKTLCPFHLGCKQDFLEPGGARWHGRSGWFCRGERAEGPERGVTVTAACRAYIWGAVSLGQVDSGSHRRQHWECPSQSMARQENFQGGNQTCPRPTA